MVVVEIGSLQNGRSILVINCYRAPSDFDFVSRFSGFLQSLEINHYYSILVVGDFNFPNIQWVEGSGLAYSSSGEEASFTSLLTDYYLFQLMEHPTRGNNILDLVITSTPTFITAGPMTGPQWSDTGVPSDHFPVVFYLSVDVRLKENKRSKHYDFKHANFESLEQTLLLIPLSNGIHNLNSQEDFYSLWDSWNDFVFAALSTFVPKVKCKQTKRPPWITSELAKAINKKKSMWKRIKNSRTAANMEKFRKLRQHLKNWIRLERRNYVKNIADEIHSNSKRFWSYFAFKNKAKPIPDKLTYNNTTFSGDRARAEPFNDFFKSVYKDHSWCQVTFDEPAITDNSLCRVQVSVEEISKILSSLHVHKAIGPDKLPTIVLKECAESLAPSVTAVVNFGLRTGFQLTEWKKANVPLIHKKGKKFWVENYRPVSLLPVISKVQERSLVASLVPYVQEVLYTYQHGFQKGSHVLLNFWKYFMRLAVPLIVVSSLTSYIWTSLRRLTLYVLQNWCQN